MSTQPPPKKPAPIVAIKQYVEARATNLEKLMRGTGLDLDRFLTLALNQTLQNPLLLECSRESWFDALQKCATHGLLPDGIHGALVPYKQRVTFQPMYQGLVQRAYETKLVTKLWAEVVYAGERFDVRLGDEPKLFHEPDVDRGDPARLVACYACARVNGETHFTVLFPKDVARHKASSKTASRSDGPWQTATAEMWKKTALIALSKTLPHFAAEARRFSELASEAERDDSIIDVTPIEDAPPPTVMDQAKERLRAGAPALTLDEDATARLREAMAAPGKVVPMEPEREPGSDDGEATPPPSHDSSHDCFHQPIHGRAVSQGKLIVCPDCKAELTVVQLRAAEGRFAQQGGK